MKRSGTFSGNIVTLFKSAGEQSDSAIGSTVGLRLNSKVSIVAESKSPDIALYSIGAALGFVVSIVLIGLFLCKRKGEREKEEEEN